MIRALQIHDTYPGDIITPGRTDKKVIRGEKPERNESYRSKVGSLNWLTMGIRYDISYTTKELSRVLAEPTETANDILNRALLYIKRTQHAYLAYDHTTMLAYTPPPTRKKPTDIDETYNVDYNITDGITHADEKESIQEYVHNGPTLVVVVKTDCDLAGQIETRQTTTSLMVWVSGALVHWRAHTERIIIPSTAAGEYVALSKGNTTGKFIRDILKFYGNKKNTYYLYTDNQAAEHIATQPTMNEHSRSIDTRHHGIRQDYVDGDMRIGGVASQDNESDILTKFLQPPLHEKHTTLLHIKQDKRPPPTQLSNCVLKLTSNRDERLPSTTQHCTLAKTQQLPLNPPEKTTRHHNTIRTKPQPDKTFRTVLPCPTGVPKKDLIHRRHRPTHKQHVKIRPRTLQKVVHHQDVRLRGPPYTRHDTTHKQGKVKTVKDMFPPTFLKLILNGSHSQPHPPPPAL
jgi:hypothetical protein